MGRLDLQARGFWNGSAVLSKANQVLTSLSSPAEAVFPVLCSPTLAETVPLSSMLPPPLQSDLSISEEEVTERPNSPSCSPPCGFSVFYLQAVISPLDYLVTLKAFLCIDNCLNGISTKAWVENSYVTILLESKRLLLYFKKMYYQRVFNKKNTGN